MHWIIHIGAPKTGSTAIQRFLHENRDRLETLGVLYPDVSLRGYGHHDLAFLLGGGYPAWATPQDLPLSELGEALRNAVRTAGVETVLLSSENFYLYPAPSALRGLLRSAGLSAEDRISVVCYLRRQDEAHVSWYNQTVKAQGNHIDFTASMRRDHGLWDYAERLKPWQAEFGAQSIMLRDYGATSADDVLTDFLAAIGFSHASFDLPPIRPNGRINRDLLDFQRLVNRLPLKVVQKRRFHKQLIALTEATADSGLFDDTPLLSPSGRAALLESYGASNTLVARTFLNREELFPAAAPAAEPAPARAAGKRRGLTAAKLAAIVRWLAVQRLP
ncbi:hypothetical protein ABMY26_18505 [Azospirillum sp. HJ39]|uniref:hypothetical protein n=1 Tax=Azospirillum sp. HJ39 TaxID=3159496 RepID=UPI00355756DE